MINEIGSANRSVKPNEANIEIIDDKASERSERHAGRSLAGVSRGRKSTASINAAARDAPVVASRPAVASRLA